MRKPNLPAEGNKDLLGREIRVGDIVAYPVTVGRSAAMRLGKVVDIYNATDIMYRKGEDVKVSIPDAYNMKVQYFPESMDWGIYSEPEKDVQYHIEKLAQEHPDPWWYFEGHVEYHYDNQYQRVPNPRMSEEEAWKGFRKYHESELRKAQNKVAKGPQPKTLLFPGKAVIISREYASIKES